jgi:hypothetical protein
MPDAKQSKDAKEVPRPRPNQDLKNPLQKSDPTKTAEPLKK